MWLRIFHYVAEELSTCARYAAAACEAVERMRFVGLVECFNESVALLRRRLPSVWLANRTVGVPSPMRIHNLIYSVNSNT